MKEKVRVLINSKIFHRCIMAVIIISIVFTCLLVTLKYNVEGEKNMPFKIEKISVISTSEVTDNIENKTHKWEYNINQVNDIFIYISEDKTSEKELMLKEVAIQNFTMDGIKKDNIEIYKPSINEGNKMFNNNSENIVSEIIYNVQEVADIKNLLVSYKGGMIGFRVSNSNIGVLASNEEEVNHNDLLKASGVKKEDLEIDIAFDLKIKLSDDIEYLGNIEITLPVGDVINEGTTSIEKSNIKKAIFKRI